MLGMFKNLFPSTRNNELSAIIDEGAFLVDVRTPGEYNAGSVQGAVNIPLDQLPSQLSKFHNRKNIIVFCQSGSRSGQARLILNKNGIQNVFNGGSWHQVNQLVQRN